jgi:hypothetical protein
MALNRRIHRAYNRVRVSNFRFSGVRRLFRALATDSDKKPALFGLVAQFLALGQLGPHLLRHRRVLS